MILSAIGIIAIGLLLSIPGSALLAVFVMLALGNFGFAQFGFLEVLPIAWAILYVRNPLEVNFTR